MGSIDNPKPQEWHAHICGNIIIDCIPGIVDCPWAITVL